MYLAFYKGKGNFYDKLIRWWTNSKYSHVELAANDGWWYTSSPRDGGVVKRKMGYNSEHWQFVPVRLTKSEVEKFYQETKGSKYDWLGIVFSQVLPLKQHSKQKWFCSEWCGSVLGYANSNQLSPEDLYRKVKNVE